MDKIRILIVEDESLVARDIENMAVSQGYEVCGIASTGDQSIEMAYYKSRLGTKLREVFRTVVSREGDEPEIVQNKGRFYDTDAVDACVKLFQENRFHFTEEART
jgi:CheY-like chemotaxis protein